MPVFIPYHPTIAQLALHPDDVLDMLHQDDRSPDNPVVTDVLHVFEQLHELAEIRGGYAIFDDVEVFRKQGRIRIHDKDIQPAPRICSYLSKANRIAVFICTAGKNFSQQAMEYNQQGDYLKGYIVDTFGSLVVEKAMDYIQSALETQMRENGMKITNRYSPGYCNWEVKDQKPLFSLLPDNNCGIALTDSCLMVPIKSVSGIIGIGREVRKNQYGCEICNNLTCTFRKVKAKTIQNS